MNLLYLEATDVLTNDLREIVLNLDYLIEARRDDEAVKLLISAPPSRHTLIVSPAYAQRVWDYICTRADTPIVDQPPHNRR